MSKKNIFIEPNEEIVSVIDKVIDNPEEQFNLVVPSGAQIWQSSINLKLLKREADLMGKNITLIVSDDLGKELAESVGFGVIKDKDFSAEFIEEEQEEVLSPDSAAPSDGEFDQGLEEESEDENQEQGMAEETPVYPPAEGEIEEGSEEEGGIGEGGEPVGEGSEFVEAETVASLRGKMDENKDNMIDLLAEEMENGKKESKLAASKMSKGASFKKFKKGAKNIFGLDRFSPSDGFGALAGKKSSKRMADIVNPKKRVKINLFHSGVKNRFFSKKEEPKKKTDFKEKIKPVNYPASVSREILAYSAKSSRLPKFFALFIGVAVVVAGVVGYLSLPSAEVVIFPKTETASLEISLTGSKDITAVDSRVNEIPLKEISVRKTKSREFLATGEKQLNEKSRGTITVYNEYSSEPQTLVATTRFESADGKIFRIPKSVIVPGASVSDGKIIASSINVEVIADQFGEEYNIGPSNFTIPGFNGTPKFASFYGVSKEAMAGGSTQKVKIVLKDDLEQAEKIITDELKEEISASLKDQIPEDYEMLAGGVKEELTDVFPTVKENDRVDKFTLEIEMVTRALLYKKEDLKSLIDANFAAASATGRRPLAETQNIEWPAPIEIDWQKGEAAFKITAEEKLAFEIDTEKIKADLAGQKEVEVRKYLSNQPEIEKATVNFWPFWVKKIPSQLKKIEVIVK